MLHPHMIILPSNYTGAPLRELYHWHPENLGSLIGVGKGSWRAPLPYYALDNGAFGAWRTKQPWMPSAFLALCDRAAQHPIPPRWVIVPDVVGDRDGTLRRWKRWAPLLRGEYGWPLAFACQDGMRHRDIPASADLIFIGGTTAWKRRRLAYWGRAGRRMHVGKINTREWLWKCAEAGAESVDGTGFFRGDANQTNGLRWFLVEWRQGHRRYPGDIPLIGRYDRYHPV